MVWKKRKTTEKSTNNTSQNTEKNLENAESKTESKRDAKKRIQRARSAQNVICYKTMMENGICVLDNDIYSKAVLFKDINYHIAPDDVKESLLAQYRQLLNSLGNDVDVSLVINNRLINREEFENNILMRMKGDGLDVIRSEMNQHLLDNPGPAGAYSKVGGQVVIALLSLPDGQFRLGDAHLRIPGVQAVEQLALLHPVAHLEGGLQHLAGDQGL